MVQYSIFVYIILFTVDELAMSENVIKNQTKVPTITSVDKVRTITLWWCDNIIMSNLTLGCGLEPNYNTTFGGLITMVKDNVANRAAIISTTFKPKTLKTRAENPMARARPNTNMNSSGVRKSLLSNNVKTFAPNNQINDTVKSTTLMITDFKTKYPVNKWKLHGFYTDDYIRLINSHWFKFMPPNPTSHYVLGILYAVIMIFGCFGNSLVIFMYTKLV